MSGHVRYSAARKIEAVRRVVEDGLGVDAVAMELGIRRGSLFFWVRRYRQFVHLKTGRRDAMPLASPQAAGEPLHPAGSLVAWLRRLPYAADAQAAKSGKAERQEACLVSNR